MKPEYKSLPYRKNVSLIVFKNKKFLLLNLLDWKEDWWKFPQGGIDVKEELVQAGRREFTEELGTDKIKVLGQSKYSNNYDWPDEVIELRQKQYRGQTQRFVVVEFVGKDIDIHLDHHEVRKYQWVTRKEVLQFSKAAEHMLFQNYNGLIPKILEEFSL